MRIDNICRLGNSGRIADATTKETGSLHLQGETGCTNSKAENRIRAHHTRSVGARCEVQQKQRGTGRQGSEVVEQLSCMGKRERFSALRFSSCARQGVETKGRTRTHAEEVEKTFAENANNLDFAFAYFASDFILAPVASNDCGSLQDNLKTSHARSLMQPCYSTCEVFLRTVVA